MNFRKLCGFVLVFFLIIVLQGNAVAATIHGTVYEWYTFKPLNNTVIEINSTPEQSVIATDSEYSFNLTPGTYSINASYFEGNKLIYTAREKVVISGEGEYVHDLLLFPLSHEELLNQDDFEVPSLDYGETNTASHANSQYTILAPTFLALIVLFFGVYLLKKRHEKSTISYFPKKDHEPYLTELESSIKDETSYEETEPDSTENVVESPELSSEQIYENSEAADNKPLQQGSEPKEGAKDLSLTSIYEDEKPMKSSSEISRYPKINLPEDLKELLDMIQDSGNRITQRELRKKSPYSESKVSLMLSDLEERGLIEKFKKGRGNIIRIPDVHISKHKHENKKE